MGVSAVYFVWGSRVPLFFGFADPPLCVRPRRSTPVGLQYERFYIPDAVRILDAIVETLAY